MGAGVRSASTINLAGKDVQERDITYYAFLGDPSQPLPDATQLTGDGSTVINEILSQATGRPGPASSSGKGQPFMDTISVGNTCNFQVTQTFNVTYHGTTYSGVQISFSIGGAVSGSNRIVATSRE